jgi:PTS system glucose-specific IIA component
VTLTVTAPVAGTVTAMSEVPDPVFAQEIVGPGVAIAPDAVGDGGAGVLVHLGIDTVKLHGEGFTLKAAEGDEVSAGDPIVEWSPHDVESAGYSSVVPVVALDAKADALEDIAQAGQVVVGDRLFAWRR